MAELVTIPISYFEYLVEYEAPDLRLLGDRAALIQAIYEVLKPLGLGIDDIEPKTTGKPSEQGVNYKLPLKKVSIFVGPSYCRFTRDDAIWETAEETITILSSALSVLIQNLKVILGIQKTVIALHLQPRKLSFLDILRPFVAPAMAALDKAPIITLASIAKWEKRKVTIDGSAAIANAVFLRFERDFDKTVSLAEIADQLRRDEDELFKMLGVEEDLP